MRTRRRQCRAFGFLLLVAYGGIVSSSLMWAMGCTYECHGGAVYPVAYSFLLPTGLAMILLFPIDATHKGSWSWVLSWLLRGFFVLMALMAMWWFAAMFIEIRRENFTLEAAMFALFGVVSLVSTAVGWVLTAATELTAE